MAKPIVGGTATAQFTAPGAGSYVISVSAPGYNTQSITIVVTAAPAAAAGGGSGSGSATMPATGGELPVAALWIGAGAVGVGALVVIAAAARRRAQR